MPTRGSRFVGLLSMIITTSPLLGFREPETAPRTASRTIPRTTTRTHSSRIRDFAQDRGALRTSGGGNIGRFPVPGLEGKQSECDGLFGFGGQAEFVGQTQANTEFRDFQRDHAQQRGILCATAGYNQFFKGSRFLQDKATQCLRNRVSGQCGGGRDDVLFARSSAAAQKIAHKLASEFLATCGFRRLSQEEWCLQ